MTRRAHYSQSGGGKISNVTVRSGGAVTYLLSKFQVQRVPLGVELKAGPYPAASLVNLGLLAATLSAP